MNFHLFFCVSLVGVADIFSGIVIVLELTCSPVVLFSLGRVLYDSIMYRKEETSIMQQSSHIAL